MVFVPDSCIDELHESDHWHASEGCYFDEVEILEIAGAIRREGPEVFAPTFWSWSPP